MRKRRSLVLAFALVALMLAVAVPIWSAQAGPAVETTAAETAAPLADLTGTKPEAKIDAELGALVKSDPKAEVWAVVLSTEAVDLERYSSFVHEFTWPAGEHVAIVRMPAAAALKVAALPSVYVVASGDLDRASSEEGRSWDDVGPMPQADIARLVDEARSAPAWSSASASPSGAATTAVGGGDASTLGWYDVEKGHAAEEAWQLGYAGEGVRVAVLDYAVDFAHPDMQGTWAVLPEGHPYGGWPQVFDPIAGYLAVQDLELPEERRSTRTAGNGWIEMYQTSTITTTQEPTGTLNIACFRPGYYVSGNNPFVLGEPTCDYRVPDSLSGTVRFGHHPDSTLLPFGADAAAGIAGQWAGVLLVDESTAGVYDTVYVDIDGDHDFTDEKPLSQSDPLSWRDMDGDGLADLTGGLLYWIADGENPFPVSWIWGLEDTVPAAGSAIGIQWATGSHGTMCASNVVSQGVLKVPPDYELNFRDLPGDGRPPSTNHGMAPAAGLVSVGSVYSNFEPIYAASWRYAVLGHDPDRTDDDIQVASNSYGYSNVDNDGWDEDSRLVDYYVRTFNPSVSFLYSTGNGGPGYGTIAPPAPSVSLGIASSTQQGSTLADSITDTTQITFGDIIPFSNRGPGASGTTGVSVAANGASGSGAIPINSVGNGAMANVTWGGTSRSSPVASGAMALVYQAFQDREGRWPTWEEARSILMSGARHAGYDTFVQGAGVIDAGDAVRIAAGLRGLYAEPSEWTAGGYRDEVYPAFAHTIAAGETATQTITLYNPTDLPVTAELSGQTLRRTASHEQELVTDRTLESPAGRPPDYLIEVDRADVPEGTDLLVARGVFPLSEFDVDGNLTPDNIYALYVLQHTDINGDGKLWEDANGNGVVDHRMDSDIVRAKWDDTAEDYEALEGSITAPLSPGQPFTGTLGWLGRGCPSEGDAPESDVSGRVALIERGVCTFNEKIRFAQDQGATAVVMYSDDRDKTAMGGDGAGVTIPGMMIDNAPGVALREKLIAGDTVDVELHAQPRVGLDGSQPVMWSQTEIEQYEYKAFNLGDDARNHWAVPVHHPLERWADGLYLGLRHLTRTDAVTNTHISLRLDAYAYEPWDALHLSQDTVSVPAGGTVEVQATLHVDEATAPGAYQGAIFVDYSREPEPIPVVYLPVTMRSGTFADAEGGSVASAWTGRSALVPAQQPPVRGVDAEAELLPGGYELPYLRTVIPVNANVTPVYDWAESLVFGGAAGYDPGARYNNGAMWGTFKWDWRAESGDWRFYFFDVLDVPDNSYWLYRTTWDEAAPNSSDIDTRVYGPAFDRFSDPDDPANREEDVSDPVWYGPYTLELLTRSPYLVSGSRWPYNTSSGGDEDWLSAPAGVSGLHEVMLHNVLFGGTNMDLPFQTEVGTAQLSTGEVELVGDACGELVITSTLAFNPLLVDSFGVSEPIVFDDEPVQQDDPNDQSSAGFKYDLTLDAPAGRFVVTLTGQDGDDLDLFVLYDGNGDGEFTYPGEVVGSGSTPTAAERVELQGVRPAGDYQIWVHGFAVNSADSTFNLRIDVVSGTALYLDSPPESIAAGVPAILNVCADLTALEGVDGPASGIITIGNSGAATLIQAPVTWRRTP